MNVPADFADYTRQLMGQQLYGHLERGLDSEPPVSIRLNPFKAGRGTHQTGIAMSHEPIGWCDEGYWLERRPNFTFDPLLHAGYYYVQESASMFVSHVLRQVVASPCTVLDLCAAPGGKSTAARTVLPAGSLLVCNEPMRPRAQVLSENIQKFGHPDVIVTNNHPRDFRKAGVGFDVIIADVPCSGEGMFRKDGGAIDEWSRQNVDNCWRLQRQIIEDIWPCLKPGGVLVYSTCTFNALENEDNLAWITTEMGAEYINIYTQPDWHITQALTGAATAYRFIPGVSRSEGLCMAVLRKTGGETLTIRKAREAKGREAKSNSRPMPKADITTWLTEAEAYTLTAEADTVRAIPRAWASEYRAICRNMKVLHAGITMGTVKGHDLIAHPSLALSTALNRSAVPQAEVGYAQAIAYLRKEAIALPEGTPRGTVLVTYHGAALGFVKNLGNRANNLYPQEWRIKSTHIPDDEPKILSI